MLIKIILVQVMQLIKSFKNILVKMFIDQNQSYGHANHEIDYENPEARGYVVYERTVKPVYMVTSIKGSPKPKTHKYNLTSYISVIIKRCKIFTSVHVQHATSIVHYLHKGYFLILNWHIS